MRIDPERAAWLVLRAREGDADAWEQLVEAYVGLIWAVTRAHRLDDGTAQDVSQTTWLRLVENLHRLQEPERVGAWLATTARRECLRALRHSRRQVLVGDEGALEVLGPVDVEVDTALLREESRAEVQEALAALPDGCRALLTLLVLDPPPSYEEVSAALGMPVGSIGPTRGRCLAKLRALVDARRIDEPGTASAG